MLGAGETSRMAKVGVQQSQGAIGENRTVGLLLKRFAVMTRIPDMDGTDFLVQRAVESIEELRARQKRIEVFGIIQSKFVEGANEVLVRRLYVEDDEGPRGEFFLMIHSDEAETGDPVTYFFTAHEIVADEDFRLRTSNSGTEDYVFSRAAGRTYEIYRNRSPKEILDIIATAIGATEMERNEKFIARVLATTTSPGIVKERFGASYIPEAGDECRIARGDAQYVLRQEGATIKLTKQSSGGTTVLAEYAGRLGEVSFDPTTERLSEWPPAMSRARPLDCFASAGTRVFLSYG